MIHVFEQELVEIKKRMGRVIEVSTQAYEMRYRLGKEVS